MRQGYHALNVERVKALKKAIGLRTYQDLGDRMELTRQAVGYWLGPSRGNISTKHLKRLGEILGVEREELILDTDQ